jgi:hypothetical protein
MNFNLFKNQNFQKATLNNDLENVKTSLNESDIYINLLYKNRKFDSENEIIIKLKNENEIQKNEISLLKSKIKKINYDSNLIQEKYKNEIIKLTNDNKKLELSNTKVIKDKENYINNIKLLKINNNKLQNDINILKSQIDSNMKNEKKYIAQISNLIEEINTLKEQQNNILNNNIDTLNNFKAEIKTLQNKLKEKTILEGELNALFYEKNEELKYEKNINQSLLQSINFVNGKIEKILEENEYEKGRIKQENKLFINIKKLIYELNEIKILVNQKDNQIMDITEDKNTLIKINNKLIFENNILKQHINKLIINIDLYINQNHLAAKRICQLENFINNNKDT